jgi:AcrR family transcriptional regulator
MVELVADRGYPSVTVRALVRTSQVSTRTFYRHFSDVEECFASTYRAIMRTAAGRFSDATAESEDWEGAIRAGVRTLMGLAAGNPNAAKLVLIDSYDGGPAMLREIEAATSTVEERLADEHSPLSMRFSQGIVAGVERVIRTKLSDDVAHQLPRLAGELADWVLYVRGIQESIGAEPQPKPKVKPEASSRQDPAFTIFEEIGGDRGRVLSAVAKLSGVCGYWSLTPSLLRREAGVSRRTFDALFEGVEDCYLEASRTLATHAARVAVGQSDPSLSWPSRLEQIVSCLCDEVDRSPATARLGFIELFAPGSGGLQCRERLITGAAELCRATAPAGSVPGEATMEAAVASTWRALEADFGSTSGGVSRGSSAPLAHLLLGPPMTAQQTETSTGNASAPIGAILNSGHARDRKHCI